MRRIEWRTLPAADDGSTRVETVFDADAPWFAGHFPGRPVLPAVAQLAWVAQLRKRAAGPMRFEGLKFRRPMGPGARLELRLAAPDADGVERFAIDADGAAACRGSLRAVAASGTAPADPARDEIDAIDGAASVDPSALLPHAGPARWIRRVDVGDAAVWTAVAVAPDGSPFVEDGRAPALLALELAAQAAAAGEAAQTQARARAAADGGGREAVPRPPRPGYLVNARGVELRAADFAVDRPLPICLELEGRAGPLSLYRFTVGDVARGTVGTYLDPDSGGSAG